MIDVIVQDNEGGVVLGRFKFNALPRIGEMATVPWPGAQSDCRVFTITEVQHIAEGVVSDVPLGDGPTVILRGDEIL